MSSTLIEDLYGGPSSAKSKVTIDDVLALKPAKRIVSVDEFNKTKDLIATSFNVSQLRGVLRSQNQPCGWKTKKSVVINQIMLLMDLEVKAPDPEPAVVEEPYTPVEPTVQKSFPSSRRELFFMLESEGDTLRRLEKDMNVRVAINIAHENYIIHGTEQAIKEAQELIRELVVVTEETWDISPYRNRDLIMTAPSALEDIARRSGTFISAGEDDTLIIAGRSSRAMDEAKRLFDLRLHESADGAESLTVFHLNDELKPLGMFPVHDSVAMTLDESQNAYFRICTTEAYAEKTFDNFAIHPVHHTPLHINSLEELTKRLVEGAIVPRQTFDLSAHFGHVLFLNKSSDLTQLPIPASFDTLDLEEWFNKADEPYFWSSLPFFKAVARLPLVSPKTKTIEAEYIPSSKILQPSDLLTPALVPVRVVFTLDHEGNLIIQDGKAINRQLLANLMLLDQPTDIQIRSELASRIEPESPILTELMSQTTLLTANRLQCPSFFSFGGISPPSASSVPAAAQVGLGSGSTHTLRSVLFRTTGVFDYNGLPLVASDIIDQYGQVRRQELKLLPVPLASSSISASSSSSSTDTIATTEGDSNATESTLASPSSASSTTTSPTSPLDNWDNFVKAALHFSRTI
ncbi:hypothetical protein BGX34_000488 [Mortierella sp. NVP85]|nr:hypothetical protein BGX34_000488 [Mortierella sp. NVP85]